MKKHIFLSVVLSAIIIFIGAGLLISNSIKTDKSAYVAQNANKPLSIPLNADTIFDLVNQERIKAGVKPLVRDDRLNATAQARADDMVARNYFSHFDPVDGRKLVNDPDNLAKYNSICFSSENLSDGIYPKPNMNISVIESWMNSQAHKDAMLNAEYDIAGLAVSGTKVVQHFCNLK